MTGPKKQKPVEMQGIVTECLSNATFRVKLENGFDVIAHAIRKKYDKI